MVARTGRFFTLVMLVTLGQGTQRGMSVQLSRSRARDLERGDFMMSRENEAFELCRGRRSIATLGRDSNEPGLRMLEVRPGLARSKCRLLNPSLSFYQS